jgi:hypothetical protein
MRQVGAEQVLLLELTRSATPASRALRRLCSTSWGTISTPRPVAPKRLAATMTMRPSPEPRSTTWSFGPTAAIRSISSVTLSGEVTKGTSSTNCACATKAGSTAQQARRAERASRDSIRIP